MCHIEYHEYIEDVMSEFATRMCYPSRGNGHPRSRISIYIVACMHDASSRIYLFQLTLLSIWLSLSSPPRWLPLNFKLLTSVPEAKRLHPHDGRNIYPR